MRDVSKIVEARKEENLDHAAELFETILKSLSSDPPIIMIFQFSYASFKIKQSRVITDEVKTLLENTLSQANNEYLGEMINGDDRTFSNRISEKRYD